MTKATITRIDAPKWGKVYRAEFRRVYFRCSNGAWAKTDLVDNFRNVVHWTGLLEVGNILGNLRITGDTVDADSRPCLLGREVPPKPEGTQLDLFGPSKSSHIVTPELDRRPRPVAKH